MYYSANALAVIVQMYQFAASTDVLAYKCTSGFVCAIADITLLRIILIIGTRC